MILFTTIVAILVAMISKAAIEEIRPHSGPQQAFLSSRADIGIYGGAAGSGKTFGIIIDPLRHIHRPRFTGTVLRRTSPEITKPGGLWDESFQIYPKFGGVARESQLQWKFPSGATIGFGHIEHEKDKFKWHGSQLALIEFDELTTFSERMFFYLLSRNRSVCGIRPYVRGSCNPDAGSWVARFIDWWIDPSSGYPIQERSGVLRWFVRLGDDIHWGDSREELIEKFKGTEDVEPKSLTFVPAKLEDNPTLMAKDPGYRANLMALPRVERERLLGGNWKITENSVIDLNWWQTYTLNGSIARFNVGGKELVIDTQQCRRFATIDTAGTAKTQLAEVRGKESSWSVVAIWDYWQSQNVLMLRHVWRAKVGWNDLRERVPAVLNQWQVPRVHIENAHNGPALRDEIKGRQVELVGPNIPGMRDTSRGAKLDRAIASGVLSAIEDGLILVPAEASWKADYMGEWAAWTGLPDQTSDQIDVSSYAWYLSKKSSAAWGGVL